MSDTATLCRNRSRQNTSKPLRDQNVSHQCLSDVAANRVTTVRDSHAYIIEALNEAICGRNRQILVRSRMIDKQRHLWNPMIPHYAIVVEDVLDVRLT